MSFWEVFWLIVISFCFIAYLMVMFSIVVDLFRDSEVSGWLKAIWVVALIALPVLTSLVYLVVRGRGMVSRSADRADTMRRDQEAYIRDTAGRTTPTDQIAQAHAMLDQGIITPGDYERIKEQALSGNGVPTVPRV